MSKTKWIIINVIKKLIFFYQESDQDTEEDNQTIAQDEAQVKICIVVIIVLPWLLNCQ